MADRAARTGRMPLAQIGLFAATAVFLGVVGGTAGWLALTDTGGNAMPVASDQSGSEHGKDDHGEAGHSEAGHSEADHSGESHAAAGQGDSDHGDTVTDHSGADAHEKNASHSADNDHGKDTAGASTHDQPAHAQEQGNDGHGSAEPAQHEAPATDTQSDHAARTDEPAPAASGHGATPHETPGHAAGTVHEPTSEGRHDSLAAAPPRVAMAPAAVPNVGSAPKPPPVVVSPNRAPLTPAPDPAITSEGRYGPLPIRSAEGKLPWKVYARPFDAATGTPRIAIVVTNMGLAEQPTLAAIQDLPGEVTLAFSPYSSRLGEWVPAARAAGHEVLLQLPMEPRSTEFNDPGNKALLTANSPELNLDRMEWVLSRAEGYVGLTNLMGSRFTVSPKDMQPVLVAMDQRGLLYIDSRESPASIAGKLALEMGLPAATNDRFIDAEAARGPIDNRLAQLEQLALARGSAVGFAADYPVAIERLRFWIEGLTDRGFVLAPVSAVVRTE
ncbi:MAG: divergent polysaccharide deacetylase family protein [Minwuia sp.]|nr:divergent polysaccharide deacetylase family protein [Minwuia sp.]